MIKMTYDEHKADEAVKFISLLNHTKGRWSRQPFVLEDWQEKIVRDLFGTVTKDGKRQYRTLYCEVPRKNGKALAIDTPIPTPDGWRRMEELKEGDRVFSENGEPCNIVFASPVEHNKDCYKITFSCGETITADADHQWCVYDRYRKRSLIRTTAEMAKDYIVGNRISHNERRYRITVAGSLKCLEKRLHVEPYTLGAWLGDGHSAGARITCVDKDLDIINNIEADGHKCEKTKTKDRSATYYIGARWGKTSPLCIRGHDKETYWNNKNGKCCECERITRRARNAGDTSPPITNGSFKQKLNEMGVIGNKHIPSDYLRASIEQRMELLKGLMDTDGYASKAGECEFTTTSETLAEQVKELIISLGFKPTVKIANATLSGKDCGKKYRIQFWAYQDNPVFKLKRKAERLKEAPPKKTRARSRHIVEIKKIESVPVKCIGVDSPNNLYLAGQSMIPTHNTTWAAAMALYMLFVESQNDVESEIYSAAADRDQASLVFNQAASMIRSHPVLSKKCNIIDSQKRIVFYKTGSFYRAIPAEAASAHGYNASCIIVDELHTQPNRELVDTLITSQGAREQPLCIFLTTAGYDQNSICWEYHEYAEQVNNRVIKDPAFYGVIYAADEKDDWEKKATWKKANPNLGVTINEDFLRQEARKAKQVPAYQNTFKRLYLNIWTQQEERWLDLDAWDNSAGMISHKDFTGRRCYAGLDLSSTTDITALVLLFPDDEGGYDVLPYFWIPSENMEERIRRDKVPYDLWKKEGLIETTEGDWIDFDAILEKIKELGEIYDIQEIAYDRWGATKLVQNIEGEGFTVVPFGQGYASMNAPTNELLRLVLAKSLRHGGNKVLRWMADCMTVKQDPAGNIKPVKPDRRKSSKRIDGIVALIMAIDRATKNEDHSSVYDSRGILSI